MCLVGTRCAALTAMKYFALDDAKNVKLSADSHTSKTSSSTSSEETCSTTAPRTPTVTRASASSSSNARTTVPAVPFVVDEHAVFLKTIIPSRKATKQYLGEESDDEDGR